MTSRGARTLRGLVAGASATLVAALSHAAAGHVMPNAASLGLAAAFAVLVAVAITGRRLARLRMAVSVVLGQAAYHVVFSTLGGAGETVATGHHGSLTITTAPHAVTAVSGGMGLAHVIAAALTVAALWHGETILAALAELGRPWRALPHAPAAIPQARAALVVAPAHVLRGVDLLAACGVRGPPAPTGAR